MVDPVARCLTHAPVEGANETSIPNLWVYRRDAPSEVECAVYGRAVILVLQGRKQARVGDDRFVYDPDHYLVTSVPLPVGSEILHASPERPFLSLALDFDLASVRELLALAGDTFAPGAPEPLQRGLAACPVTAPLRNLTLRLLDLLDHPEDVAVLAPLYRSELLYHVLRGPRGGLLRAVAMGHGQQRAIADVLATIHADCTRTFTVPELAAMAAMSESVFYEAFRSVTAATPLQYIKRLRLQEAHRRLSRGLTNVSGAAHGVGYQSLSQFSREFSRLFGTPPSACAARQA